MGKEKMPMAAEDLANITLKCDERNEEERNSKLKCVELDEEN